MIFKKGKSGGYRLIYWLPSDESIVLLDIYSKSDQPDIDISEVRRIVEEFGTD